MFTDSASDEEILQAARLACLDRFLGELSDGLDTVLLLNECTSALDEETETELLRNIASLKGK